MLSFSNNNRCSILLVSSEISRRISLSFLCVCTLVIDWCFVLELYRTLSLLSFCSNYISSTTMFTSISFLSLSLYSLYIYVNIYQYSPITGWKIRHTSLSLSHVERNRRTYVVIRRMLLNTVVLGVVSTLDVILI
jgi:ABC-type antimicrobial peptide transport system permease subunit